MFGWLSRAMLAASRWKRSSPDRESAMSGERTFTARRRPSDWSSTRKTTAKPPDPRRSSTTYCGPSADWRSRSRVAIASAVDGGLGKMPGGGEIGIEIRGVAIGGETGGVLSPVVASLLPGAGARQTGHAGAPEGTTLPQVEQFTRWPGPSCTGKLQLS